MENIKNLVHEIKEQITAYENPDNFGSIPDLSIAISQALDTIDELERYNIPNIEKAIKNNG